MLSYYDMLIAVVFELLLCYCCCKDVMGDLDCSRYGLSPLAESADAGWRCPGCRSVSTVIPSVYKCFCGKAVDPCAGRSHRDMTIPHSCGKCMVSPVFFLTSLPFLAPIFSSSFLTLTLCLSLSLSQSLSLSLPVSVSLSLSLSLTVFLFLSFSVCLSVSLSLYCLF